MSILDYIKSINRRGGSVASLVILLGGMAFTHWSARLRMDMANRQFAVMDDRTSREMMIIDFIHEHLWILVAYAAVFLFCLLWLEFRTAPRWAVWVSFAVFALPFLAYARACLHIGNKFIMWSVR